ncbi:MAG: helix-turn-helix transcriptional regulator [Bacillota bacterium]
MGAKQPKLPTVSDALRAAIIDSTMSHNRLAQESGVERLSISRFVKGERSMRLDMADRLAAYFGLVLKRG